MVNIVGNRSDNFGAYAEDISNFFAQAPQATMEAIGAFGKHTVTVLSDLAKITKSSEALKQTLNGLIDLATLINMVVTVHISKKAVEAVALFTTAVNAMKIGASIKYILHGTFLKDIDQNKLASVIAEVFFCAGRVISTGLWLIELNVMTVASASALVGQIPVFGSALLAVGSGPAMSAFFFTGIAFLLVDRLRAALKGGYASDIVEADKAREVRNKVHQSLRDPVTGARYQGNLTAAQLQAMDRSVAEKKALQQSIAWVDCVNLVTEALLIACSFAPFALHTLGFVAASTNVASTIMDKEPPSYLQAVRDTQNNVQILVRA